MAKIFKLHNQVKHYDWGSPDWIPNLMGVPPTGTPLHGEPWAELWMGTHPASPSRVCLPDGEVNLGDLLGASSSPGGLPFLFKLLAAERPLSIQVHPNLEQAREGFEQENKAGVPLDDPARNYRDPNHKPEIICALSPFTGMCGFRSPYPIQMFFATFLSEAPGPVRKGLAPLVRALEMPAEDAALRNFLQVLFDLSPTVRAALTDYILLLRAESGPLKLVQQFARLYPGDPAILSPFYMNIFYLEPGEALFLQAGVPHAYIHGFGVELMANSDNVLRGGLTAKHIDIFELMRVLDYKPLKLQIMQPPAAGGCFTYPTPCDEFSLTVMRGGAQTFTPNAPAICIVTQGELCADGAILKQGESAFISDDGGPLALQGNYTLYVASVP